MGPPAESKGFEMEPTYGAVRTDPLELAQLDVSNSRRISSPPQNGSSLGTIGRLTPWLGTAALAAALGVITFL